MNHLSTAELLLLAEGELDEVRAAHAAGCADCQAASRQALGELGEVTRALASTGEMDAPEAKTESWARLRGSLQADVWVALDSHIEIEELLLHLDGEAGSSTSAHLESCADCHDDLLRAQTLLVDIEHELRALIPEESKQARLASASRLEKALDARRSRVLTFPAPWRAVYAAAALIAAGLFGFTWFAQQPAGMPEPVVALAPAPEAVAVPSAQFPAARSPAALSFDSAPAPAVSAPTRFQTQAGLAAAPEPAPIAAKPGPALAYSLATAYQPSPGLPRIGQPQAAPAATAMPAIATAAIAEAVIATEPTRVVVTDKPLGGVVRTALLEHYGDAARRSFRTARPDLLEGELARYVSEILHAESELLRHAYELHEMLDNADAQALDAKARKSLRSEARKSLSTIRTQEELLYTKLSEALPRRYWAAKGDRSEKDDAGDPQAAAAELLRAALALDKNLTGILVESDSSVSIETASLGDLLYTVRATSRNLQERLSVLR